MRNKILVDLENSNELNIYEAISERGKFKKFIFSIEELNYIAECGYIKQMNFKHGLTIDLYEEQVICDKRVIFDLLEDTRNFKFQYSNAIFNKAFDNIINALELALKVNSCVYFIL